MDGSGSGRGFFSYALTWPSESYIESYLKVAIQSGLPPIAVIMNDPTHKEWTVLDLKLAKAYELRQSYGDIPPWIDRSDRVHFDTKSFISGSGAAIERAQAAEQKKAQTGRGNPTFGKRWYAVPVTKDGGPMPTMREWLEDQRRLNGEA